MNAVEERRIENDSFGRINRTNGGNTDINNFAVGTLLKLQISFVKKIEKFVSIFHGFVGIRDRVENCSAEISDNELTEFSLDQNAKCTWGLIRNRKSNGFSSVLSFCFAFYIISFF